MEEKIGKGERLWNGICNFCRRSTDRKFMLSVMGIVGVIAAGLPPEIAAAFTATIVAVFVVMKGFVEMMERWKDIKIEEAKAKNGGEK